MEQAHKGTQRNFFTCTQCGWRFEKEFQAKKKEIMKIDPFIYNIPETNNINIGGVVKNDDSQN